MSLLHLCRAGRHRCCGGGCPCRSLALDSVPKKYREVRTALLEAGWEVLRQRGSHEVWGKPGESARIVVAGNNSDTVPVGTLASIRRASGLEQLR
jgi:predicted RNA binding protein YcfA (HicA-like mRNA interferase family)